MCPGVGGPRSSRTKHSCRDPVPGGSSPPQPHPRPEQPLLGLWARPAEPQAVTQAHGCSQVRELIDKVRAVFVETLGELSWMDEASKKKAQEKVGGAAGPRAGLPAGRAARAGTWPSPSHSLQPGQAGRLTQEGPVGRDKTGSQAWETRQHPGVGGETLQHPGNRGEAKASGSGCPEEMPGPTEAPGPV